MQLKQGIVDSFIRKYNINNKLKRKIGYILNKYNIKYSILDIINGDNKEFINEYGEVSIRDKYNNLLDFKHPLIIKGTHLRVTDALFKNKILGDVDLISEELLYTFLICDPTNNKIYTEWLLNVFNRVYHTGSSYEAANFISEDLNHINHYLGIFNEFKNKKIFKDVNSKNPLLKHINGVSDIKQYKSLSELFKAIDPFIIKDNNEFKRDLELLTLNKDLTLLFKDDKFTVYTPNTLKGCEVFYPYAKWCTAIEGNTMFKHYTNFKCGEKKKSKLYIILDDKSFDEEGEDSKLYQFHFESNQLHNKYNTNIKDLNEELFDKSIDLKTFFKKILLQLTISSYTTKQNIIDNTYFNYLIKFGYGELIFNFIKKDLTTLIIDKDIKINFRTLPNLNRFTKLKILLIKDNELVNFKPDFFENTELRVISFHNNNISNINSDFGKLTNVVSLNFNQNPIRYISNNIKNLDVSNGGALELLSIPKSVLKLNVDLEKLLPNTKINYV